MGAAYGTVLASIISLGVSMNIAQRYCYIKWEWKKILLIIVQLLFCLFGVIIIKQLSIDHNLIIVFKIFFISCFVFLGITLKILNKSSAQNILDMIQTKKA